MHIQQKTTEFYTVQKFPFRISNIRFFYFYFVLILKNSWNFMNFHKLSWALPRPKNVCSNSLRWWCFLVKSSYPCTRICQEIRWFQQAFEMPKIENFENFKRSFQIMKKNFQTRVCLEKSHFSEAQNALMFFRQIVVPLYEDLPGDPRKSRAHAKDIFMKKCQKYGKTNLFQKWFTCFLRRAGVPTEGQRQQLC